MRKMVTCVLGADLGLAPYHPAYSKSIQNINPEARGELPERCCDIGCPGGFSGSFALRLCWKLPGSSWKLPEASWGFLELPGLSWSFLEVPEGPWKSFSGHLGCSWSAPGRSKRLPKVSQRVEPDLVRSELWRAILYAFLSLSINLRL